MRTRITTRFVGGPLNGDVSFLFPSEPGDIIPKSFADQGYIYYICSNRGTLGTQVAGDSPLVQREFERLPQLFRRDLPVDRYEVVERGPADDGVLIVFRYLG